MGHKIDYKLIDSYTYFLIISNTLFSLPLYSHFFILLALIELSYHFDFDFRYLRTYGPLFGAILDLLQLPLHSLTAGVQLFL